MKNRIISFVLTLVMLFSCLSLDIFAAGYAETESTTGLDSEKTSASNSQKATYNSAEQIIADYFEKYGTIGKSGGYNLTAAQLAAKVMAQDYGNPSSMHLKGGRERYNHQHRFSHRGDEIQ